MEFIEPNVECWQQDEGIEGVWKHIARCTRVCYQSEKKNNNETEEEFVKRVILRNEPWNSEANHLAMLEHGTVYLKYICKWVGDGFVEKYKSNKYSKVTQYHDESLPHTYDGWLQNVFCITTNLRVLVENRWDDLKYICSPTKYHAYRFTFCFTTNIGVSREFNRHRVNSIAEESTRYCNYNKRSDGQIKFTIPTWITDGKLVCLYDKQYSDYSDYIVDLFNTDDDNELDDTWLDIDYYMFALKTAEMCYNGLIRKGWKPQQAREVLPLATKTQLIHTAFEDDWKHFLRLRSHGVSGAPHPNAKILADKLAKFLNYEKS